MDNGEVLSNRLERQGKEVGKLGSKVEGQTQSKQQANKQTDRQTNRTNKRIGRLTDRKRIARRQDKTKARQGDISETRQEQLTGKAR